VPTEVTTNCNIGHDKSCIGRHLATFVDTYLNHSVAVRRPDTENGPRHIVFGIEYCTPVNIPIQRSGYSAHGG
jgi:hypothetical protein